MSMIDVLSVRCSSRSSDAARIPTYLAKQRGSSTYSKSYKHILIKGRAALNG